MSFPRAFIAASLLRLALLSMVTGIPGISWADQGFQAVSPDELKLSSEPMAPGAPAIILYRQVDRDDSRLGTAHQYHYVRIKILTEEGRKYANVEIPFYSEAEEIINVNGRTIRADGSIANWDGKVYDKSLAKIGRAGLMAKTFTLPAVEVGAIIEYYYTEDLKSLYDSHWILSENLFTKNARFSLKPYRGNSYYPVNLRWTWHGLPPDVQPKAGPDNIVRMEASNIAAFQTEDFMPPANELKARVDFIYQTETPESDPAKFWQQVGKSWNGKLESFVGKHKIMEEAVSQIISPDDPPEAKLRKIYARVQEIRNKTYEVRRSAQEDKRNKEKPAENVEDVWKRGYGTGTQLTWLYLALVRAAGFEAYGCWVSSRRQYFFNPSTMETAKLNSNVVLVKANGTDVYVDPGAEFTPFGMLTWTETGVQGLCLNKDGGSMIRTTLPQSSESRTERKAKLTLSPAGDLQGKITLTYIGLDAMYRRLQVRNADELTRKKFLEAAIVAEIPAAAEAELTNQPDWSSSETPLVAEFNLKVQGWALNVGKRVMIPAALFTAHEKHIFEHANRVHPIYFEYPNQKVDEISIELAPGWQVSTVPPEKATDGHVLTYQLRAEGDKQELRLTRKLTIDFLLLDQKYYAALRNFFESVRTADDQKIVLQSGAATASN